MNPRKNQCLWSPLESILIRMLYLNILRMLVINGFKNRMRFIRLGQ